ncbi:MAG: tyrosine-type recombinase/integrase [Acidimicrobiia bacterium]|nr:tyrosine-type recombinase/integrase [Acidimicrobiia bacterium]
MIPFEVSDSKSHTATIVAGGLDHLLPSWELHLRALNRSPKTITTYLEAANQLLSYLEDKGMPTQASSIHREHLEAFLVHLHQTRSASTAANRYRSLRQLFRWLEEDGEVQTSPMARMRPPSVEEQTVPVIPDDDLKALVRVCQGQGFEARRDTALILVFLDTGARLSEIADLQLGNVDLYRSATLLVRGKGNRDRLLKVGPKTSKALDRYLRVRGRHPDTESRWVWLGKKGKLTGSGIAQMLRRRCEQAGIDTVNPHQFRHTFSHKWLAAGGGEQDLMMLTGWKSRDMLARYGASTAAERARDAHQWLSPVERLL